jgi:2,3-diketo-5-methylthio-1-phosphopentane phosphatase
LSVVLSQNAENQGPVQQHPLKVFIDFDGTISTIDTGEEIFRRFGKRPEVDIIIEQIREKEITAKEGWARLFAHAPGLELDAIYRMTEDIMIDDSFKAFTVFLRERQIPFYILSDGFENYIRCILEREGLGDIPVFSNRLIETRDKEVVPVFPSTDEECTDCANCKRNHVLEQSADDEFTVYIGNGSSDTCPAQFCDYIFAKDDLLRFCNREKISCYSWSRFAEVQSVFMQLLQKKRLKKRHQATLKRNEVYKLG